jgi:Zn finger protein HypA/HybF involved in hydrogenase expression
MYLIERIKELFHPQADVASNVEYWCYDCYQMFDCKVDIKGTDWSKLTVICTRCKSKSTIIHKVNGTAVRAD